MPKTSQNISPSPAPPAECHRCEEDHRLKQWFGYGLRFLVPIGCSVALLLWLFHKVNFGDMMRVIRHGVDYWWLLVMMLITTLSHMIRGYRWGIQLRGVGVNPPLMTLFVSIWGAYALNLIFNTLGEAWRCLFISKREKVSLSTVVGTDVGDRSSDLIVVLMLLALLFIVAGGAIHAFLVKYAFGREVVKFADNPWMWGLIFLALSFIWAFFHIFRKYKFMDKVDGCLDRIWLGFKVLFTMHHKGLYVILTLGIWTCYFMETYVTFFAFPFTRELISAHYAWGFLPGLVCFVFCSMSMIIPSNGGLGPWNLAMIFGLSLFGIGQTKAAAFAMLMWSSQALMLVLLGIFSLIYVMLTRPKKQKLAVTAKNSVNKS